MCKFFFFLGRMRTTRRKKWGFSRKSKGNGRKLRSGVGKGSFIEFLMARDFEKKAPFFSLRKFGTANEDKLEIIFWRHGGMVLH